MDGTTTPADSWEPADPDARWQRAAFTLDGADGTFGGYTRGAKWNGWECPAFPLSEAKRLAANLRGADGRYDPEADAIMVQSDAVDWPEEYGGFDAETVDGPMRLYPVGAYCWTWYTVEDDDPGPEARPGTIPQELRAGRTYRTRWDVSRYPSDKIPAGSRLLLLEVGPGIVRGVLYRERPGLAEWENELHWYGDAPGPDADELAAVDLVAEPVR